MSAKNMFPFTSAQWQELEHQALIFKYMVSGIPIPPDLLFSVKRSSLDSPPFTSKLFPHHPQHVGWNYLQMGLGRKIDPEPGRCRRTDGKKWRCSKEAFPDSKYCERHMHRGKNRSRKPVEVLKTTPPPTPTTNPSFPSSISNNNNSSILSYKPFASSRPISSTQDTNTLLLLESASHSDRNQDYRNRYIYGLKEEVDEHEHEHVFFSQQPAETNGRADFSTSSISDSWQLTPLTMSCSSSAYSKQRNCSVLQSDHHSSYQFHQSLTDPLKQQKKGNESQKTIHRFFDEWPPKERESWLDFDDDNRSSSNTTGSVSSTTQLSISIPTAVSNDFPIFRSRNP